MPLVLPPTTVSASKREGDNFSSPRDRERERDNFPSPRERERWRALHCSQLEFGLSILPSFGWLRKRRMKNSGSLSLFYPERNVSLSLSHCPWGGIISLSLVQKEISFSLCLSVVSSFFLWCFQSLSFFFFSSMCRSAPAAPENNRRYQKQERRVKSVKVTSRATVPRGFPVSLSLSVSLAVEAPVFRKESS